MNFELITDPSHLLDLGWKEFVDDHPFGTVFQSPVMFNFFAGTDRMKPVVIAVADKDKRALAGILLGVVIREMNGMAGYFSSRTVIYGGPLIEPGNKDPEQILRLILSGLIGKVKNHSIFIQFRNFYDQSDSNNIYTDFHFNHRARLNLILDTSSLETVRKNMSGSRIRQVNKGLRLGAILIEPENTGQVRDFYRILSDLYRYKVKKPLPGWDFFNNFYNLSKEGKLGIIRLVKFNDRIIGGILCPVTPGKTIYEWYVCGLDSQYREVHPSVLATWSAIDYAINNNIPEFDFMGVGLPDREYGVRDFKKRFGGEIVNYGRFARINNSFYYGISEIGYNLLSLVKKNSFS